MHRTNILEWHTLLIGCDSMHKKLTDIPLNETVIIKSVLLPEKKRFKLLHFGVLEGKKITCLLESPLKGARAYKTTSTIFTLRDEDASLIWVMV